MNRRRFLGGLVVVGAVGLVGCDPASNVLVERIVQHCGPLVWDRAVSDHVHRHARAMARERRLWHSDLGGLDWTAAAEIVGHGDANGVMDAWLASEPHRAILDQRWERFAVGGRDGYYAAVFTR